MREKHYIYWEMGYEELLGTDICKNITGICEITILLSENLAKVTIISWELDSYHLSKIDDYISGN